MDLITNYKLFIFYSANSTMQQLVINNGVYIQQLLSTSELISTNYILSWCVTSTSAIMPLSHIIQRLSQPVLALS